MKYGLSNETIGKIQQVLRQHPEVTHAILYGSRAKGNFKNGSDIDLTLLGENISRSILGKIIEELDDLLLPYKIDLSIFSQIQDKDVRDHIERVGILFYEKNG
ncbi:MAG: nucleotidyltransferase domain-containing protein [Candidatus Hydrogenedentota bacterium]|nr:MAG: nucleotidyltransferase domain-containing protein [Candidatus Hydrogenedentota bacterium]